MRPTWHLVAAERHPLDAETRPAHPVGQRIAGKRPATGATEQLHYRCDRLLEKCWRQQKPDQTTDRGGTEPAGIAADTPRLTCLLMRAETEAVVCSGPFSGGKQTYAPLEERVPPVPELHPDEALAKLATAYFSSHFTGQYAGFRLRSGPSVTEARHSASSEDR